MRRQSILRGDAGAALVAALALCVLVSIGAVVVAQLGRMAVVQERARAAADLAALAAAGSLLSLSEDPCAAAARTAARNRAHVLSCALVGAGAEVVVEVQVRHRGWPAGSLAAQARAGVRPVRGPGPSASPPG
jgi:secretion/DNA translocation related TadE-like protein